MGSLISIDRELTIYMDGRRDAEKDLHSELHGKLVSIDEGFAVRDAIVSEHKRVKEKLCQAESRLRGYDLYAWVSALCIASMAIAILYLLGCINHPNTAPEWLRPVANCEARAY